MTVKATARSTVSRCLVLLFLGTGVVADLEAVGQARAGEVMSKEILSVLIRKQGYTCEHPRRAVRDVERSTPGSAAWYLECDNARYSVHLVPNMRTDVTILP